MVTFTNFSQAQYPPIAPVVGAEHYGGAPGFEKITAGTLQRFDSASRKWTAFSLGEGTGTDFMRTGGSDTFMLPPDAHKSIRYRLKLSPSDAPGVLQIDALAVPDSNSANLGNQPDIGNIAVAIQVVKSR